MTKIGKDAQTALLEIQEAIYGLLSANLSTAGVYDFVPEDAPYPFVTIGEATEIPRNTHDNFGREVTVTIHVWTKGMLGFSATLSIANEIQQLLDHQQNDFSLENHRVIAVRLDQVLTLRDPDPSIRHVPMRFRIVTEQL